MTRRVWAAVAALAAMVAGPAAAAGLYAQEQSVEGLGRAYSGEAAGAGADAMFWNPAAIADVQGASQIMERIPDAVSIFILPPDWETLERRLRSRGLDAEAVIRRRLDTARREIENYSKYDYILINDLLEQSVDQLKDIVVAERLRQSGAQPSGDEKHLLEIAQACRLEHARERVQPILASFHLQAVKSN